MNTKKLYISLALTLALLALAGALTLIGATASPINPQSAIHNPQSIGGPGGFGYVYTDSLTDPTLYNWVDVAASGTALVFGDTDEGKTQVDLLQTMTFYGEDYTQIYVAANGYATFQNTDVVSQCVPAERQPPDTLAAFCTDLDVGNTVYYSTTSAYNGHETFIIQYDEVTHTVSGLTATFQIILDFTDDSITYQYLSAPTSSTMTTTIGIIGYATNRDDYLTYCRGTADCPPQNGMAVRFALSARPDLDLQIIPSDDFPEWGDTVTYTIVMNNTGDAVANGAVMTNTLPTGLDYVTGTLTATAGITTYLAASRTVRWDGDLAVSGTVTVTYAAALNTDDYIYNTAVVTHPQALEAAGATSSPADEWSDPEPLAAPHKFDDELGGWRHIAVDTGGVVHVAYAGASLYYATLSGTVWISETSPGTVADLELAALVLDDQDHARIAFYGDRHLWLARQISATGGLTWTVEEIADIASSWELGLLDLQQGSDGSLHLVYDYDDALYYTAYSDTVWLTPTLVITDGACDLDDGYSLALDQNDVPHVACEHSSSIPRQVRLYTYTAAAPWTTYAVVSSGADFYCYPSLAYDGNTPHLSFFRGYTALYHAQPGGSWETTLVDDPGGLYLRGSTALDVNSGQVGIAYTLRKGSYGNYTTTVRYASRPLTGTAWTTETVETFGYDRDDPRPTLALDGGGKAHVAYYYRPDKELRYAAETASFTIQTLDESRTLNTAAIAVGSDESIHVAYLLEIKGLYHATVASDTVTWTTQLAVPGVEADWLDLALDASNAPHAAYADYRQPLYHATLNGSAWITRQVDTPGDVSVHPSIGAGMTGTAHIAYMAQEGSNFAVRHAAFDGASWTTETLAVVGPDDLWGQKPRLVAQGGKVYVLYADCTAYQADGDYPIDLALETWDGSSWSSQVLYHFAGQCNWNLDYQLLGDEEGQLTAVATIGGESVRPSPLVATFWIEESGGQRSVKMHEQESGSRLPALPATGNAPASVTGMGSVVPWYLRLAEGWLRIFIEAGKQFVQSLDKNGNLSKKTPVGDVSSVVIEDADGNGKKVVVVVRGAKKNKLEISRTRPAKQCCLNVQVAPAAAANAGCTAAPPHTEGECGAEVEITAQSGEGWAFTNWSGAASGSQATTKAAMTGQSPKCSAATANFAEIVATAPKSATPASPDGVYPGEHIDYRTTLNWKGPDTAVIIVTDPYPWPRVTYIAGSLAWGSYIDQCQHDTDAHSITCNGLFPASEEGVSTNFSFKTEAACDLYTTQDTDGPVLNTANVQIGDFHFNSQATTEVKTPFLLKTSTPKFIPQGGFAPGHTVLLYTVPKGDEPDCCTTCDLDVYVVVDGDTDNPLKMENQGEGVTDRTHADFIADDCHHSLWFKPTENRAYSLNLYVVKHGDTFEPYYLADSITLEPAAEPELVVFTDQRELFNEFNKTSANSPAGDANGNCIRDYYDAVERMRKYAEDHNGVALDIRQDAYDDDYDYSDEIGRDMMDNAIDWLVSKLPAAKLEYIAIIGDDAVAPFYRYPDPLDGNVELRERKYLTKLGDHNVATVKDTQDGFIMTDVPYSTQGLQTPKDPTPDYALGRIFAPKPLALVDMINAYEKLVIVGAKTGSAFVFNVVNDEINMKEVAERAAINVLQENGYITHTTDLADRGKSRYRGWMDGNVYFWLPDDVTEAMNKNGGNRLTVLVAHATHLYNKTPVNSIQSVNIDSLPTFPGAVFMNLGCHSGYSTGYDATPAWNYYQKALVRAALERHFTYHAPTTYGYTTGNKVVRYHDRRHQQFLEEILGWAGTTGEAYLESQRLYPAYSDWKNIDTGAMYGTELYGLPTQPIQRAAGRVTVQRAGRAPGIHGMAVAQTTQVLTVSLVSPNFDITTDGAGHTWFEVPHGGELTALGDGPYVPLLVRTFYLPAGTAGLTVTLVASDTTAYPETVQLPPQQVGNRTYGVSTVPFSDTALYPAASFWTTVYTDSEEVRLLISAVPLRYDPVTGQVTLTHQMDFWVEYDLPATGVQVESLTLDNGNPVEVNQADFSITMTVASTGTQPLTLLWVIQDQGGAPLRSGRAVFTPTVGSNIVEWHTDSLGWPPGPRVLHVTLEDEDENVAAAAQKDFTVQGRSLTVSIDQGVYGSDATQAAITAEVCDETGAEVAGLAGDFAQELNGSDLTLAWQEGGSYTATLDLATVATGTHLLNVALSGGPTAQISFGVDRDPPTSTLSSPTIVYSPTITVTISGGDDLSGLNLYHVQYRVEESGAWTGWLTRTAGWDYSTGGPADLSPTFGPTQPVTLVPGAAYYFRVRAVDRAGNEEAEHTVADTATTYETCVGMDEVNIAGPTSGITGATYTFTATVSPPTATLPITYTWEAEVGQVGNLSYVTHTGGLSDTAAFTWAVTGTKRITVTAVNCGGTDSYSHVIIVTAGEPYTIYLPLVVKSYAPNLARGQTKTRGR